MPAQIIATTPAGPILVGPSVGLSIWEGLASAKNNTKSTPTSSSSSNSKKLSAAAPEFVSVTTSRTSTGGRRTSRKHVVSESAASAPAARRAGRANKKGGAKKGGAADKKSWEKSDKPGALEKLFLPDVPLTRSGVSDLLDSMCFAQPQAAVVAA